MIITIQYPIILSTYFQIATKAFFVLINPNKVTIFQWKNAL